VTLQAKSAPKKVIPKKKKMPADGVC